MDNYVKTIDLVRDHKSTTVYVLSKEDVEQLGMQLLEGVHKEIEYQRLRDAEAMTKKDSILEPGAVKSTYHISNSTLYRLAKAGVLVPIWVGGQRRYRRSDVEAYINK